MKYIVKRDHPERAQEDWEDDYEDIPYFERSNTATQAEILRVLLPETPMSFDELQSKTASKISRNDLEDLLSRKQITIHKKKGKFYYLAPVANP
jgi:hypothetical protein